MKIILCTSVRRTILSFLRYNHSRFMSVKSYVFLDLETTGLPLHDFGETKITELTMLAVLKDHLGSTDSRDFPRVLNKLTITLNPLKYISPDAAIVTGLVNEMLDDFQPFDEETCDMLITFIKRLPQPVCLLAHNGDRFDFPILKAHMKNKNKEFPDGILCADTLKCFRALAVMTRDDFKDENEWDDDFCPIEINQVISEAEKLSPFSAAALTQPSLAYSTPETSPTKCLSQPSPGPSEYNGYKTPEKSKIFVHSVEDHKNKGKVHVSDVRKERTPNKSSSTRTDSLSKRCLFRPSYTLSSVYNHVTGNSLTKAHSSEYDCLALLEIITVLGKSFNDWISINSKQFSSIRRF